MMIVTIVSMPDTMKAKALQHWQSMQTSQAVFAAFVQGCMDGLGLEGDWNLNTATWQFERQPEKAG